MKNKIAARLAFYTILFSSVITLIFTAAQLFSEFQYKVNGVNEKLEQIKTHYTDDLSQALRLSDKHQIMQILGDITESPDIEYAEVRAKNNAEIINGVIASRQKSISFKEALKYRHNNKNTFIGSFIVTASLSGVYNSLLSRLWIILFSNALRISLTAVFIYLLFTRLITRHLLKISNFSLNDISATLKEPLSLDRAETRGDELDRLTASINALRLNLYSHIEKLNQQKLYLSQTLHSIGDAVITTDVSGNVNRMNPVAEQLTGWFYKEARGLPLKNIFSIIDASTREVIENPVDKVIATGTTVYLSNHTTLIAKNGNEYQIADSAAPIRDNNQILGMVLVFNDVTEQYYLRQIATKNRRDLQSIMNNSPAIIYVRDIAGKFTFINQQCEKLLHSSNEKVSGKTVHDFFPEDIANEIERSDKTVLQTQKALEFEEILPGNKGLRTYLSAKFPLFDDENNVYAVCNISTDITERQRTELMLQNIAEAVSAQTGKVFFQSLMLQLAKIFDVAYVFTGLLDEQIAGRVNTIALCVHNAVVKNINYNLRGTPCHHVVNSPCDNILLFSENIQQLFPDDDLLSEMSAQSYMGSPLINSQNETIGLIVIMDDKPMQNTAQMKDILKIFSIRAAAELERMQTEETLRESEKKYHTLATVAPVGIFYTDKHGSCLYVNEKWCKITGITEAEALGSGWEKGLHPDDRTLVLAAWENAAKQHLPFRLEYRFQQADAIRWVFGQAIAEKNDHGEVQGYVGTITDITEYKKTDEALRHSQKMDALGKLTGGVAHDYNNMLGVILGYTELLEKQLEDQPILANYAHEIHHAGERGARLTQKLLSFSRQKTTNAEVVNINALLHEDQHMLEKTLTTRISLVFNLCKNIWPVWLNRSDLEDVIINMSINGQYAMKEHGQLTIQTSNVQLNSSEAQQLPEGDYVSLIIADTGCGMDETTSQKIFEPFYTTKGESGNGLGLSQAYSFVTRSGGAIRVHSRLGEGTQFSLYFPRYQQTSETPRLEDKIVPISATKGDESILVVDDEPALVELSCEILQQQGYHVHRAENARQALRILTSESIDLLLSDVILPEINGYELATMVQKKYPHIKIQLASGFSDDRDTHLVDDAIHRQMLHKPYRSQELLQRIRERLDE